MVATDAPSDEPAPPARNGVLAWSRVVAPGAEGSAPRTSIVVDGNGGVDVIDPDVAYHSAPAWSPDGRSLAYVDDGRLVVVRNGSRPERAFTCRPPTCLGIGPPSWSPAESAVAFGLIGERAEGLAVLELGARRPEVLPGLGVEGPPAWSPDGTTFAVPAGDRIDLVDRADGTTVRSVAFPGRLGAGVAWSPLGDALAVEATSDGTTGLWLVPIDGGPSTLLTSCPDDGCTDIDPAWSPDGRRLAFTRARCDLPGGDCSTGDLFVLDVDGGAAEPLVTGAPLDCCAAWQPLVE